MARGTDPLERTAETLYGRHAVAEALQAGRRRVLRVLLAEESAVAGRLEPLLSGASGAGVPVERVPRAELDRVHTHHQGVAARVSPYPYIDLADVLERVHQAGEPALVLILDSLQDPQNLGTLLRTAAAVGVHGVVLPLRRGAGVTPAVVSASAGAVEHMLVAQANLAGAIARLKQEGVWVCGLENRPEAEVFRPESLQGPLALVVGGEAAGLRPLVRQLCDRRLRLPMRGPLDSLNAAVAGSIALYLAWSAREAPPAGGHAGSIDGPGLP